MGKMPLTPSQTIGPFFHEGLAWAFDGPLPRDFGVPVVRITGVVRDGQGQVVPDALLEIWQPTLAAQARPGGQLPGFQRADTRRDGRFAFFMPRPGKEASCAHVTVLARGLLRELRTRVYALPPDAEPGVWVAEAVPADRRHTLVATPVPNLADNYSWDVILQGVGETVFLEF